MLSGIPPQAQSTPSLGNKATDCSKVDHSAQIISPEQVMAQSPLLIDEVSCVDEEFSEVMFGEVSSTSCDTSVQLITPQVSDVSVVAESLLQHCDTSDGVAPVKLDSSFCSENLFDEATLSNKVLPNNLMTTNSHIFSIAKHSNCCITVKKVTNADFNSAIEELVRLPIISISVTTEPIKLDHGIGEALRGHGKVQEMPNGLPVPLLHCEVTGIAIYGGGLHVYYNPKITLVRI